MKVRTHASASKPHLAPTKSDLASSFAGGAVLDRFVPSTTPAIAFDASLPLWRHVIAESLSPERAKSTLELLAAQLGTVPRSLGADAALLVWAGATSKDREDSEGLVVPFQSVLALSKLSSLDLAAKARLEPILDRAGSPAERAVLLKAIGARRARPVDEAFLAEIGEVADRIRGHSLEWLLEHTTGYGIGRALGWRGVRSDDAKGTEGNRQFDPLACQLTMRDLAEAEFDPLMALRISMDPAGRSAEGSYADRHQIALFDAFVRDVLPKVQEHIREDYHPALDVAHYLRSVLAGAGLTDWRDIDWNALDRGQKKSFLDDLETATLAGFDTLVRIKRPKRAPIPGLGPDVPRHFEAIVDVRWDNGTRFWRVHDPDPRAKKAARDITDRAFLDGPFLSSRRGRFKLERLFAVAAGLPASVPGRVLAPERSE